MEKPKSALTFGSLHSLQKKPDFSPTIPSSSHQRALFEYTRSTGDYCQSSMSINNWMRGLQVCLVHKSFFLKNIWATGAGLAIMFYFKKCCAALRAVVSNTGLCFWDNHLGLFGTKHGQCSQSCQILSTFSCTQLFSASRTFSKTCALIFTSAKKSVKAFTYCNIKCLVNLHILYFRCSQIHIIYVFCKARSCKICWVHLTLN